MAKVQQFKHKPGPYEYGQYHYEEENLQFQLIEESNSVQKPYDKYDKQTLETTVVTDVTRDKIIENQLRRIGDSFIKINNLRIDNRGVNHKVKNTHFRGFLFDRNTFDCFKSNGELKSYNDIDTALYRTRYYGDAGTGTSPNVATLFQDTPWEYDVVLRDDSRLFDHSMIFNWNAPRYSKGKGPGNLEFLEDKIILQNLSSNDKPGENFKFDEITHGSTFFDKIRDYELSSGSVDETGTTLNQPFNPMDGKTTTTERFTSIFNENNENNYLQFVVWMRGDARRAIGTKRRKKSIAVIKISPFELFDSNYNSLGSKRFDFSNPSQVYGGGGKTAAFKVSNISLTIDTTQGASIEDFQESDGTTIEEEILTNVTNRVTLTETNFDFDLLQTSVFNENYTIRQGSDTPFRYRKDFTPVSEITIDSLKSANLQMYKTNTLDKQICSTPNVVSLNVHLVEKLDVEEDRILERDYDFLNNNSIPPFYKFAVLSWDDKDDSIISVDDYFDLKPNNYNDLVKLQEEKNTFIFKNNIEKLTNVYRTPGLKKIKIIVFSCVPFLNNPSSLLYSREKPFDKFEIGRYKLLTSKIYLEPSSADFQDFSEIGGDDYITIPFNNTVPIIGGVSDESKYKVSIENTINGSNIQGTDVNELILLKQAKENDELGKTINKMDLEQCRYFNKSYNMDELLQTNNPKPSYPPEYYAENPDEFPFYKEEFDFNGNGSVDGADIVGWVSVGRNDIVNYIQDLLDTTQPPFMDDLLSSKFVKYNNFEFYDGERNKYSEESSIGQIFINDNLDLDLKQNCKLELNTGELNDKSIYDSSGNANKGILIGDYKIKKTRKGEPMRRDSFIKTPKKSKQNRAL